jgi:chromosome segregation ATPase
MRSRGLVYLYTHKQKEWAAFLVWKRFRRKYQQEIMQLKTEYANASYEYEENLRELQLLESAHQENESERKRLLDENVELQSRIHELQKEKAISRNLSASALFAEKPIVKRFHEIAVQPLANVKEEEWAELTDTFANSYPDLFLDL